MYDLTKVIHADSPGHIGMKCFSVGQINHTSFEVLVKDESLCAMVMVIDVILKGTDKEYLDNLWSEATVRLIRISDEYLGLAIIRPDVTEPSYNVIESLTINDMKVVASEVILPTGSSIHERGLVVYQSLSKQS